MKKIPNPGSKEAQAQGCTCAIMDNHYGEGFKVRGKIQWWIDEECPIHGEKDASSSSL